MGEQIDTINTSTEEVGGTAIVIDGSGNVKKPRKVLHFSDGTLEEYSTDEEEEVSQQSLPQIDTKLLPWRSWFWFFLTSGGSKALAACDYMGETLANFFGITAPRYQYEIQEFDRMNAEEEERRKNLESKKSGWVEPINKKYVITEETVPLEGKRIEINPKSNQWKRY